jgi:hypothetical protein
VIAGLREVSSTSRFAVALALVAAVFLAQALFLARVLVPYHDESAALFAGSLIASGRLSLYDDAMPGSRSPAPSYIFGATQVLWGRSLMAARLLGVAFGVVLVILTGLLGRRIGGDLAGILAAALLTAQGALVGYYALGNYHALVPMAMMAGLLVWLTATGPAGNVAGAAILGGLFFLRTHVWTLPPVVLVLALRRARGWGQRALVAVVMVGPPLLFFLWDVRHLKLLASLPVVGGLVRPLGYVPFILLDERPFRDLAYQIWTLVRLARRYEYLLLATAVIVLLALARWLRSGTPAPYFTNRRVNLLAGLFLYMLVALFVAFRINFKWIGVYFTSIAPLLTIVVGYLASRLLAEPALGRRGRAGLSVFLAVVLVLPIYFNRNPLKPEGAIRRADPVEAVRIAGAHLARLVPPDARVFFFGPVDVFYFSGLPPTWVQQITAYDTLAVNDRDRRATLRSGYYGMTEVERWLGVEADYAVVSPEGLATFAEAFHNHPEINRPKVARMRELLAQHFVKVGTVTEYPYYSYEVYRRLPIHRGLKRPLG